MNQILQVCKSDLKEVLKELIEEIGLKSIPEEKPIADEDNQLHSIKELADFLKVSVSTAMKYKNEGMPVLQYGRKVIFDKKKVLNWLESGNKKKGACNE